MSDLIKALQIFVKYGDPYSPLNCSHDTLWVDINPELVRAEDKAELDELGFFVSEEDAGGFTSYRFGSC